MIVFTTDVEYRLENAYDLFKGEDDWLAESTIPRAIFSPSYIVTTLTKITVIIMQAMQLALL